MTEGTKKFLIGVAVVVVNTTLMALGLMGLISPGMAALLHNASTVMFSVRSAKSLLN